MSAIHGRNQPHFRPETANLKIMGGDADVDNFLKATRSNIQDLEASVVELKAKALKKQIRRCIYLRRCRE